MDMIYKNCQEITFDTNVWRWCGVGIALVFFAAVDIEAFKGGVALLPVVVCRETASFFLSTQPGVEANVSSAGSICASAFVILTCTKQLSIIFSV